MPKKSFIRPLLLASALFALPLGMMIQGCGGGGGNGLVGGVVNSQFVGTYVGGFQINAGSGQPSENGVLTLQIQSNGTVTGSIDQPVPVRAVGDGQIDLNGSASGSEFQASGSEGAGTSATTVNVSGGFYTQNGQQFLRDAVITLTQNGVTRTGTATGTRSTSATATPTATATNPGDSPATTIPGSMQGTYNLTYQQASTGGPVANGTQTQFVLTSNTLQFSGKTLTNPVFRNGNMAEWIFRDGNFEYAASRANDNSLNEINVAGVGGTPFYGQYNDN
jgi:hypothetical protein